MEKKEGEHMEVEVTTTIKDIPETQWNTLTGTDYIDKTYAWYRTAEDSRIRKTYYILLKKGENLKAAVCGYPYKEELHKKEMLFLEVRSPLGTATSFYSDNTRDTHILVGELEKIQDQTKAEGTFVPDFKKEEFEAVKDHMKGFTDFPMHENTYLDLDYTDFDDYLSTLSRKNRGNIRNTMNKARKRWNITCIATNELSQWKEVAARLQRNTCEKHDDYRWYLTEEFYEALFKHLKDNVEMIVFLKDDIPLACGLTLNSPTICQCKAAGIDPKYRKYQAYFLMYYEEIKRALERNQKRIYFGTTAYGFKERLGAEKEELYGFVKLKNPLMDLGLKSYITYSKISGKKM